MLNRHVPLVVCLFVASLAAYGDTSSGAQYVVEFPSPGTSGAHFQGFLANGNSQNPVFDATGPTNISQILFKPDGTKAYILGSSGIQSVDPAFSSTSFHPINGISGTPTTMAMSPDGKYLYIGASGLIILDTSTDQVLSSASIPITGSVIGVVFSNDSSLAYVLTDSVTGSALTVVNTAKQARVGQPLPFQFSGATGITLSPKNLIYVTETNRIYSIDPAALAANNANCAASIGTLVGCVEIDLNATPGPLQFTADGTTAYFVNNTANISGGSLLQLNATSNTVSVASVSQTASNQHPIFSQVIVASSTRIFALTLADTTVWDVTPSPLSVAPSSTLSGVFAGGVNNVVSAVATKEQPAAKYLFLLVVNGQQTNLVRVILANNTSDLNIFAPLGVGVLQTALVPPQTGAASFVQFNTNQTVKAGGTSLPLGAIVLDGTGLPVYNLPVTYTETDSIGGVTFTGGANQTTNANGYVQTTVTLPTTPGTYIITLTAGSVTATYALTISGSGTNPGGPGPSSQVSIVGGNGLLMRPGFDRSPIYNPLTILVTDTSGKPMQNVAVTFSVVSGPLGAIDNPTTTTDKNGLAMTDFIPALPQQGIGFASADVNASTDLGSVDFKEVSYITDQDRGFPNPTGAPQVALLSPGASRTIAAGVGDTVTDAIVAQIIGEIMPGQNGGIPDVGIRIADGGDITMPGPASCPAAALSDSTGTVHCNLTISCASTVGSSSGMIIDVGGYRQFFATLQITTGSSRTIKAASGDKQSGQAGQTLSQVLVALVTDNCGNPIANVPVTWTVSGSATLTKTTTTSNGNGQVSTSVMLGQIPGSIKITASLGANGPSVVFTATNSVTVGSISLLSGGGQSVKVSQAFPQPLVFVVKDTQGNPVQGISVSFSIVGGSASLSTTSATSNSSGQVSVNVTAGGAAGNVTIQASYSTFNTTAQLTVTAQGPGVTAQSFYSAASNPANSANPKSGLVPCGLGAMIGGNLAPSVSGTVLGNPLGIGPLPYTLQNLSMTLGGIPVPLYSITNLNNGTQIVYFQTPCEVPVGSATAVITITGAAQATTTVQGVNILATSPGLFTYAGPNGVSYAAIIRGLDGSYVTPSSLAHRGETYYAVATNLGQTTPAAGTNTTATGNQSIPIANVVVGVNNAGVPVQSAVYVAVGVYYVGFQIPSSAQTGTNQPFALAVNGVFDGQGALIPGVQ